MCLVDKIKVYFGEDLSGKIIVLWGLVFKFNIDDIWEVFLIYIIQVLFDVGVIIWVYDFEVMFNVKVCFGDQVFFVVDQYEVFIGVDGLVIVIEWSVFCIFSFEVMKELFKNLFIFDGCNFYDLELMQEKGFYYESIGCIVV